MNIQQFEYQLSDLMKDLDREIESLDPEISEEEYKRNQLYVINKALDDAHSELLKYKRIEKTTCIMNPYAQIAEDHLSIEEMEAIIAKKKGEKGRLMNYDERRIEYYREKIRGV